MLEVGDDHHVLREAPRNRERLRKRLHQEVAVPPVEQTLAAALRDAFELRGEAAEVVQPHVLMVACTPASSPIRDDAPAGRNVDDGGAQAMQGGEE